MTPDILDYLSGRIPLGLWLLPLVGSTFAFVWWVVWSGTKFWSAEQFRRMLLIGWTLVFASYMAAWSVLRPPPIPIRILVTAGEPGEKTPGPWAEGVADAIRHRLALAPETFVPLDEEIAPAAFASANKSSLEGLAIRMRVEFIVSVIQDPAATGEKPIVHIAMNEWSGGHYSSIAELATPPSNLSGAMRWGAEQVAAKLKTKPLADNWLYIPPSVADSVLVHHYLTFALRRQGQTEVAAAFFTSEAAADSHWSAPRIELARTWLMTNPVAHEDVIRTALLDAGRLERENPEIYLLLGKHFLEFRDWEEAESALKLAYNYNPDDPRVNFYLSRLMDHRLTDLPITSPDLLMKRALQLAPGYETARLTFMDYLRKGNEKKLASDIGDEGLRVDPDSRSLLLTESAIFIDLREYARAEALCRRLLAENTSDNEALYNFGLCRLWVKDYEGAIAAFDSSYNCGGSVENIYYLGVSNQLKKDYPKAIEWFGKRLALMKDQNDQGANTARERIKLIKEWMVQDSLERIGQKPMSRFEKAMQHK
jgi:tetratricopeptide (TPR) repeat protein